MNPRLPRDAFIDEVRRQALSDTNVYFMSADLGAKALDRFRQECPRQFIHAGISEQNMMDVAAGMAQNGKLVYTYAMAPFVTLRCFEQIKVSIASMNLPVVIVGNGVGYSYDGAGPTHYGTEDLACMRSLGSIEILTPCDEESTISIAQDLYQKPRFAYVRLDRRALPNVYQPGDRSYLEEGVTQLTPGKSVCIVTSGYLVHQAPALRNILAREGIDAAVIDITRLKPLNLEALARALRPYDVVVTWEEHFLSAGFGSAIAEALADLDLRPQIIRIGLADEYRFENAGRERLHQLTGIDPETAAKTILDRLSARKSRFRGAERLASYPQATASDNPSLSRELV